MRIPLPVYGLDEGPWVLAMNVFEPIWRGDAVKDETEIVLVAYGRMLGSGRKKKFLSYHARVSRRNNRELEKQSVSDVYSNSDSRKDDMNEDGSSDNNSYTLKLLSSSCSPATSLPWNPLALSNSGKMCVVQDKLVCYAALSDAPQPMSSSVPMARGNGRRHRLEGLQDTPALVELDVDPTSVSVEPWSGAVALGTPGHVRILWFD